jgi:hypothetical protein
MYHPYLHQDAKQIVEERRSRADVARQVRQLREARRARGEPIGLISRFRARLSSLLGGLKDRVTTRQRLAQNLPAARQVPGLAED